MTKSNVSLGDDTLIQRSLGTWVFPHTLAAAIETSSGGNAPWFGDQPGTGSKCSDLNIGGHGASTDGCVFIYLNKNGTLSEMKYQKSGNRHVFSGDDFGGSASVAASYSGNAVKVGDFSNFSGTVATPGSPATFTGTITTVESDDGLGTVVTKDRTVTITTDSNVASKTIDVTYTPGQSGGSGSGKNIATIQTEEGVTVTNFHGDSSWTSELLATQTITLSNGEAPGTSGTITLRSLEPGYTPTPPTITGDGSKTVQQLVDTYMATDPFEPIEVIAGGSFIPTSGVDMTLSNGESTSYVQVSLTANTAGAAGNNISLIGDNFKTLTQLAADWNAANPDNQVTVNSGGGNVLADYDGMFERGESAVNYAQIQLAGGETSLGSAYPYVFIPESDDSTGETTDNRTGMRIHPHGESDKGDVVILYKVPYTGSINLHAIFAHYHGTTQKQTDNEAWAISRWTKLSGIGYKNYTADALALEYNRFYRGAAGNPGGHRQNIPYEGDSSYQTMNSNADWIWYSGDYTHTVGNTGGGYKNITFSESTIVDELNADKTPIRAGDIIEIAISSRNNPGYGMLDFQMTIEYTDYRTTAGHSNDVYNDPRSMSEILTRLRANTCLSNSNYAGGLENFKLGDTKTSSNTNYDLPVQLKVVEITTGNINGSGVDNATLTVEVVNMSNSASVQVKMVRGENTTASDDYTFTGEGTWKTPNASDRVSWTGLNGGHYCILVKATNCTIWNNHTIFINTLYEYL